MHSKSSSSVYRTLCHDSPVWDLVSDDHRRQHFSTSEDHKTIHSEVSSEEELETSVHMKPVHSVEEGSQKHTRFNGQELLYKNDQKTPVLCVTKAHGRGSRLEQALSRTSMSCLSVEDPYLPERDSSSDSDDLILLKKPKRILKKKFRRRSSLVSKNIPCSNLQPLEVMMKPPEESEQRTCDQPKEAGSHVDQRLRDLCELQSMMATDLRGLRTEMANIGLILGKMLVLLERSMTPNSDKT